MASAAVVSNAIVLEVLNQHNYKHWSSRVQTYLLSKDLWDVVKVEPPTPEDKAWTKKNAKALHAIKISCGTDLYCLISEIRTAKNAWEVLEKEFKSTQALCLEKEVRDESEISLRRATDDDAGQVRDEHTEIKANEGESNNANEYSEPFIPFFNLVMSGDWDEANKCLTELKLDLYNAVTAIDPRHGRRDTALHIAARQGHLHIVKELALLMTKQDLEVKNAEGYTALQEAVIKGNADIVKELLLVMRPEGPEIRTAEGCNALHLAVMKRHVHIVKVLVPSMREEALETKDGEGYTAFGRTLDAGHCEGDFIQMAKYMVEKNKKILSIGLPPSNRIPVVKAFGWSRWEMGRYLYSVTPLEALLPENGTHGAQLINIGIRRAKGLDIAWDLLQRCPSLAIVDNERGCSPMSELARMRYAFLSGTRLTFWQQWIYNRMHIQPIDFNVLDICINVSKSEHDQSSQGNLICSGMSLFKRFAKALFGLLGINQIYEMKSTHVRVFEFLRSMGEVTRNMNNFTLAELNIVKRSIFIAIEHGHVEFVTHLCKANPKLVDTFDENGKSIFQFSIECRQERIYNLIYGLEQERRTKMGLYVAKFNKNMLHSAGNLSPLPRFNHIQDASLQMQRELQWFKEVKSIVPSEMHEYLTISDGLTARELFTKNHKKLVEEAKISMKGTATSCTTIGALIVTIMFAVALTVPGGYDNNTGLPIFMDKMFFNIFIISDTISLISSTTSVITFLGILTSRYAEDDFLKSLPTKMMIGLLTLFFSIVAMMIAFSCALIIILDGKTWIVIPSILLASVPVFSFVWLLFPLLVEIFMSTYGGGIFDRKVKSWF